VEEVLRHVQRPAPPSRATNHTIIFLTDGEAHMHIGGERYTIQEDEMLVVAAGQVFSFDEYSPDKFNTGFLFHFDEQWLAASLGAKTMLDQLEFLDVYGNPRIRFDRLSGSEVLGTLNNIYSFFTVDHRGERDPHQLIPSQLATVLAQMSAAYRPPFHQAPDTSRELTSRFRRLLAEHHTVKHRVTDYAGLLHVSPNHLNKVVREITSRSPTRWIDEAILLDAKVLLGQTQLSVGEIAAAVGIEDASYFSRLFKKYEGMAPLEYRKRVRGE
jgi:AraC family transcriptional activator of pobA